MSGVRVRNPAGNEQTLLTPEECLEAIATGSVDQEWEVFHVRAGRWLPIRTHPHFRTLPTPVAAGRAQRSPELVLIHPAHGRSVSAPHRARDPLDSGPHLSITEIERVLGARLTRPGESDPAEAEASPTPRATDRSTSGSGRFKVVASPVNEQEEEVRSLRRYLMLSVSLLLLVTALATDLWLQNRSLQQNLTTAASPAATLPASR